MPNIKELLKAPLAVPRSIEAKLPKGVPRVSSVMESITAALPAGLTLPAALPTGALQPLKITEFIKRVEAVMPNAVPRIASQETPPAPKKAPELIFE